MIRRSSISQQHTESSRVMRGAWKAECEYIFELHTERLPVAGSFFAGWAV
ncbi:MAG: hypothetical protein ACLTC4_16275 [Hungatella hathewayi]|nr:hypothetical protein [Hungatella hathewayi]MBS4984857.1 hypothetical protein [Hungatella hathewayi]